MGRGPDLDSKVGMIVLRFDFTTKLKIDHFNKNSKRIVRNKNYRIAN